MRTSVRSATSRLLLPLLVTGAVLSALAARPNQAEAQLTPADSAAVLLETASLFERQGKWEVAEALYMLIVERYATTPAAAAARTQLSAPADSRIGRSGRTEMLVWSTTYGLWLGVAVPLAFGSNDSEAYGVGLLLGGPVGLLTSRALTRSRTLGEGQTRTITWGGTWGTWQGYGWSEVLDIGEEQFCVDGFCYESGDTEEERVASMIVGGLVGIGVGAILARNPVRLGVASGANYGSLWGTWLGVASNVLFDVDGGDSALTVALLAGNAGLVGGALVAGSQDMSRNRVRLISVGGLVGGLGGAGLDLIIQPDGDKAAIAIPLIGSLFGLGVGAALTRDYDRGSASEGAPGSALLRVSNGRWGLDVPTPSATLIPVMDPNGRIEWRAGLAFELFRARF